MEEDFGLRILEAENMPLGVSPLGHREGRRHRMGIERIDACRVEIRKGEAPVRRVRRGVTVVGVADFREGTGDICAGEVSTFVVLKGEVADAKLNCGASLVPMTVTVRLRVAWPPALSVIVTLYVSVCVWPTVS